MIALDTETTGVDFNHGARPFFVTLCDHGGGQSYYEWDVDPLTREVDIPDSDVREIKELLKVQDNWYSFSEDIRQRHWLIFQNSKFDCRALASIRIDNFPWRMTQDTLVAGHLLASNHPHDLTSMLVEYLGVDIQSYEDRLEEACQKARQMARRDFPRWLIAKEDRRNPANNSQMMPSAKGKSLDKKTDKDRLWQFDMWLPRTIARLLKYPVDHSWWTVLRDYSNADSASTMALWKVMERLLKERGLWEIYVAKMAVTPIAAGMERRGITFNHNRLLELHREYSRVSEECRAKCENIADGLEYRDELGRKLRMPSGHGITDGLRRFIYDKLNLPKVVGQKAKTDKGTLDKDVLRHYLDTLDATSKAHSFVKNMVAKRKRDSHISYLTGYTRHGLPYFRTKKNLLSYSEDELKELDVWRIMFSSLNPTGTDHLRWSSSNPNQENICVDSETEFLTEYGWVKSIDLTSEVKVAQYWKESGSIDFVESTLQISEFSGNLQHITTDQGIDMCLTPAHRCLVQNRKTLRKYVVRADQFPEDCRHLHAGIYIGGEFSLSDDEITWLCAVQADGHYVTGSRENNRHEQYGIQLVFKKTRKIERLRNCLNSLRASYIERNKRGLVTFYVYKNQSIVRLAKDLMPDKCFDNWILSLDRTTLSKMCNEVFFWDGGYTTKRLYSSSTKKNSDWVQILMTISGHRASLSSRMPSSSWAKGEHHYVNVTLNQSYSLTTNRRIDQIPHNGSVYCVTVPSSYVVIRRDGKVSITGNSKQEDFNLRYCFGPAPGREWWSLDAKNVELRIPAYEAQEPAMMKLLEDGDKPPFYGNYYMFILSLVNVELWERTVAEVGIENAAAYIKKNRPEYKRAKAAVLAKNYGAQQEKVDATFGMDGAYKIIAQKLPKLEALSQKYIRFAEKNGYVETLPDKTVNPKRGYPLLCSRSNWGKVLPTVPFNYHVSGTAMFFEIMGMVRMERQLEEWRKDGFNGFMIMQIHDEEVLDFPKSKIHPRESENESNLWRVRILQKLKEQGGEDIDVPIPVGIEFHPDNWAEGISF